MSKNLCFDCAKKCKQPEGVKTVACPDYVRDKSRRVDDPTQKCYNNALNS